MGELLSPLLAALGPDEEADQNQNGWHYQEHSKHDSHVELFGFNCFSLCGDQRENTNGARECQDHYRGHLCPLTKVVYKLRVHLRFGKPQGPSRDPI